MNNVNRLTDNEVCLARKHGIFTVTSETASGYYVTCFQMVAFGPPVRLSQSKECIRPSTARRYSERLVRDAMATRGKP
jgi:hypothetical protein